MVDHAAYGRCRRGHVLGRFDAFCQECWKDELRTHGVEPRSHTVVTLCDCHASPGDPHPDPRCPRCGGRGEYETPF